MPIKKVDSNIDFISMEHKILDFWEKNQVFNKRVEMNQGRSKWSFLDGPITANNPMGVHHAWGRTLKDLYQRYKAMTGHELRYQNGFDCQGLWVEIEVEKELGFTTKRDVEKYGIEKFVNKCKERVQKYSKVQSDQSIRLGYWMDWNNSYYTMSDENNYTIWAFLKKLFEENKIYMGTDVVPWSGRSGTSYSQMEIIEGRRLVAHDALFIRFPLKGRKNENLLIWTTTPWTLTSNVAAAVNRDLDYSIIRAVDGSVYYCAAENLKHQRLEKQFKEKKDWIEGVPKLKTIAQIFKEHGGFTIEGSVKGSEMIGWEYEGPFDSLEAQSIPGGYPFTKPDLEQKKVNGVTCHKVIDGGKDNFGNDVVVAGEGTGIVHIAPGCGDIDNQIGKDQGLVDIAPLDEESKFIDGFGWLTGLCATAKNTKGKIIADLKNRNLLIHVEQYPHVYPHCWRSGDELVFRIVDEWYINMDWRGQIKKIVSDIQWIPEWGHDREMEWLDNMGDWMISKKRFWGLALPIWIFEDGSFFVVGSKKELKELAIEGWDEFDGNSPHRPWIDKVKIRHPKTGLIGTRINDVGNPWLDAGIVPYSTIKYTTDRDYWRQWFPAEFITECFPGQFRNWFYSLLAMSTTMEGKAPFKSLLGHAMVKDEKGQDMHKSSGNAIWFDDAAEEMGVDVMRWMYISQKVEHNLLFGYGLANNVRKKLITLWNSYSFFATYAAVDGFDPGVREIKEKDLTVLDRWIRSKTHQLIQDAHSTFDNFTVDRFMRKMDRFFEDLSNWYIRRNRRRFWKSVDDQDKLAAYQTLYDVLFNTIKLLAPMVPFITEEIYQNLVKNADQNAAESVHLCDYPAVNDDYIDESLMRRVDTLKKLVELGRSARNKANLKIRQPLSSLKFVVKSDDSAEFILDQKSVVLDELNVKSIERFDSPEMLINFYVKPNLKILGQKYGENLQIIRKFINEKGSDYILNELESGGELKVISGSDSFILTREDLLIEPKPVEGFTSATDEGLTVGLLTELNDELVQEGVIRDFIRQVQIMRKEASFAVEDRIEIFGKIEGKCGKALEVFKEYFYNETLTVNMNNKFKHGEYHSTFKVRDEEITVGIQRITKN